MSSRTRRPRTGYRRWLAGLRRAAPPAPGPGTETTVDTARPLTVHTRVEPGCTLIKAKGEIDISTSPELTHAMEAHAGTPGVLVVDLSGVTFMDSTGLRALVAVQRERASRGAQLAIICPPGPARLICEVAGVEQQLPLHATCSEAAAALQGTRPA